MIDSERISASINAFYDCVREALEVRIPLWGSFTTSRGRADGMGEHMVVVANLCTEVEERLASIMLIQSHVSMMWAEVEAQHYAEVGRLSGAQYTSQRQKLAGAISKNPELWETKYKLDTAVDCGQRAIDRLAQQQAVASRIVSVSIGS